MQPEPSPAPDSTRNSTPVPTQSHSRKRKRAAPPAAAASPAPSDPGASNPPEQISARADIFSRPQLSFSRGPIFIPISESSEYYKTDLVGVNRVGYRYVPAGINPQGYALPCRTIESNPSAYRISWEDRSPFVKVSKDGLGLMGSKGFRSARCNAPMREGKWYMEVKILAGGGEHEGDEKRREGSHVRLGWGRREAPLNGPVGLDGYSYGYRDKTGDKVTLSRPRPYGRPYASGDVIGMYISLPSRRPANKDDPLDPAHLKRERIPIDLKGQEMFESLEYTQSKEMTALMDFSGKSTASCSVPSTTKAKVAAAKPTDRTTRPTNSTKAQNTPVRRPLPTLPDSRIAFFVNGECQGIAFQELYDYLQLRQDKTNQKTKGGRRQREGVKEHRENPFDDGWLGYYPFISLFNNARVQLNPGPDFDFPPPPNIDAVLDCDQEKLAQVKQERTWRPACERYAEFMREQTELDAKEEEEARAELALQTFVQESNSHGRGVKGRANKRAKANSSEAASTTANKKRGGKKNAAASASASTNVSANGAGTPTGVASRTSTPDNDRTDTPNSMTIPLPPGGQLIGPGLGYRYSPSPAGPNNSSILIGPGGPGPTPSVHTGLYPPVNLVSTPHFQHTLPSSLQLIMDETASVGTGDSRPGSSSGPPSTTGSGFGMGGIGNGGGGERGLTGPGGIPLSHPSPLRHIALTNNFHLNALGSGSGFPAPVSTTSSRLSNLSHLIHSETSPPPPMSLGGTIVSPQHPDVNTELYSAQFRREDVNEDGKDANVIGVVERRSPVSPTGYRRPRASSSYGRSGEGDSFGHIVTKQEDDIREDRIKGREIRYDGEPRLGGVYTSETLEIEQSAPGTGIIGGEEEDPRHLHTQARYHPRHQQQLHMQPRHDQHIQERHYQYTQQTPPLHSPQLHRSPPQHQLPQNQQPQQQHRSPQHHSPQHPPNQQPQHQHQHQMHRSPQHHHSPRRVHHTQLPPPQPQTQPSQQIPYAHPQQGNPPQHPSPSLQQQQQQQQQQFQFHSDPYQQHYNHHHQQRLQQQQHQPPQHSQQQQPQAQYYHHQYPRLAGPGMMPFVEGGEDRDGLEHPKSGGGGE